MKTKIVILVLLLMLVGIAVFLFLPKSSSPSPSPSTQLRQQSHQAPLTVGTAAVTSESTPTEPESIAGKNSPTPTSDASKATPSDQVATTPVPTKSQTTKKSDQDPEAREALKLVGTDPDAEQTWLEAINNPNLSAAERRNLIEDLNEDGFSDPKHPGPQDLPLIKKRLELIEKLISKPMDQANAEAFKEAQKDLTKMLNDLSPQ
jgi:hypothetical protein